MTVAFPEAASTYLPSARKLNSLGRAPATEEVTVPENTSWECDGSTNLILGLLLGKVILPLSLAGENMKSGSVEIICNSGHLTLKRNTLSKVADIFDVQTATVWHKGKVHQGTLMFGKKWDSTLKWD